MCGLAGFALSPTDQLTIDRNAVARRLLLAIEHRGKDATGAAWRSTNNVIIQKSDMPATKFVPRLSIARRATTVILHTRMATQGKPEVNVNNHPIRFDHVVGVHNGMLNNDWELFRDMKLSDERIGEVDSEAAFAAIARGTDVIDEVTKGDVEIPVYRLTDTLTGVLEQIEGSAALAWMDEMDPEGILHLARLNSSPLFVGQSRGGSLFFASTANAVDEAMELAKLECTWAEEVKEGTYYKVDKGRIVDVKNFTPAPMYRRYVSTTYGAYGAYGTYQGWDADSFYDPMTTDWVRVGGVMRPIHAVTGEYLDSDTDLRTAALKDSVSTATPITPFDELKYLTKEERNALPWLDAAELLPMGVTKTITKADYEVDYAEREEAIDAFMATGDPAETIDLAADFHAFRRPGDWVSTHLLGRKVTGRLVALPQTFPEGVYTVLLYVPAADAKLDRPERVFALRTAEEFCHVVGAPTVVEKFRTEAEAERQLTLLPAVREGANA